MSLRMESFLARLYVDAGARQRFLRNPDGVARRYGLSEAERAALIAIDRVGLELAAASFARKRAGAPRRRRLVRLIGRLTRG
jgi:hypothetical protein